MPDAKLGPLIDIVHLPFLMSRSTYSVEDIRKVERTTGRPYVGSYEDEQGHYVPVFSKEVHNDGE